MAKQYKIIFLNKPGETPCVWAQDYNCDRIQETYKKFKNLYPDEKVWIEECEIPAQKWTKVDVPEPEPPLGKVEEKINYMKEYRVIYGWAERTPYGGVFTNYTDAKRAYFDCNHTWVRIEEREVSNWTELPVPLTTEERLDKIEDYLKYNIL